MLNIRNVLWSTHLSLKMNTFPTNRNWISQPLKNLKETKEINELEEIFFNQCTIMETDCEGCKYEDSEIPCKKAFYKDYGFKLI